MDDDCESRVRMKRESEAMNVAEIRAKNGRTVPVGATCGIGRSSRNDLVLRDDLVSRSHALVHQQGGEYWLVDLGSSNGTKLNGCLLYTSPSPRDRG